MWITLPSTANKINVQEISKKSENSEHLTSNCKLNPFVSDSCKCLNIDDYIDMILKFETVKLE